MEARKIRRRILTRTFESIFSSATFRFSSHWICRVASTELARRSQIVSKKKPYSPLTIFPRPLVPLCPDLLLVRFRLGSPTAKHLSDFFLAPFHSRRPFLHDAAPRLITARSCAPLRQPGLRNPYSLLRRTSIPSKTLGAKSLPMSLVLLTPTSPPPVQKGPYPQRGTASGSLLQLRQVLQGRSHSERLGRQKKKAIGSFYQPLRPKELRGLRRPAAGWRTCIRHG